MQTIIDDLLTNYDILGKNNKSGVLILHGWGHNLNSWLPIANLLSTKHKVYLVDLPGFGSSYLSNQSFDTYDYAILVTKFIRKMKLKNYTLIGHSFGGKIAIVLASRQNSIKKLFLVSPSGINERSFLTMLKIQISKIIKFAYPVLPVRFSEKVYSTFAAKDYKTAGPLKDTFKKVVAQNVVREAKKIKVPTIIFWGEEDKELEPKYALRLRNLIKKSHVRIVWKTGHSPHIEDPNKFYGMVTEYL